MDSDRPAVLIRYDPQAFNSIEWIQEKRGFGARGLQNESFNSIEWIRRAVRTAGEAFTDLSIPLNGFTGWLTSES